jgi:Protein of unknown function (DUF2442)
MMFSGTAMSRKVIQVQPQDNHQLRLQFDNGETRLFDVAPYLTRGIFAEPYAIFDQCGGGCSRVSAGIIICLAC